MLTKSSKKFLSESGNCYTARNRKMNMSIVQWKSHFHLYQTSSAQPHGVTGRFGLLCHAQIVVKWLSLSMHAALCHYVHVQWCSRFLLLFLCQKPMERKVIIDNCAKHFIFFYISSYMHVIGSTLGNTACTASTFNFCKNYIQSSQSMI